MRTIIDILQDARAFYENQIAKDPYSKSGFTALVQEINALLIHLKPQYITNYLFKIDYDVFRTDEKRLRLVELDAASQLGHKLLEIGAISRQTVELDQYVKSISMNCKIVTTNQIDAGSIRNYVLP